MKSQPNRDYISNDVVMTPQPLARTLIDFLRVRGHVLEPCCGTGNIVRELKSTREVASVQTAEISAGIDFLDASRDFGSIDEIFTNPPWSKIRLFLERSFQLDPLRVSYIMTVNHAFVTSRWNLACKHGYSISSITAIDWPKDWPKSGFVLGCVSWTKGRSNSCSIHDLRAS